MGQVDKLDVERRLALFFWEKKHEKEKTDCMK